MIWRDIEQHSHIGAELVNIIELKTTHFHHIPFTWLFCYLPGKAVTDITYHGHIVTGSF